MICFSCDKCKICLLQSIKFCFKSDQGCRKGEVCFGYVCTQACKRHIDCTTPGGRCTPDGICTVPCHGNTQACGDNHWVCESGMCEKRCYYAATDCHWSQVVVLELHHSETSSFSYLSECLSVHGFCLEYTHEVASKFKIMWFRHIIAVQPIKWNIKGK